MPKVGEEYELFVKEVYEILNSIDGLEDVKIQHDIKLRGKSREHQIDIYWEFTKAGVPFRVVVECKDYKNPVKAERIEAFHTALEDLNNPMGIFVTKHGFQEGAKKVAEYYGIQAMVIHGPEDENWNGYIKEIHIALVIKLITNRRVKAVIDKAWVEENGVEEFSYESYLDTDVFVIEGETRTSLNELVNRLPRDKEGRSFVKEYRYEDGYIEIGEKRFKIHGLIFTYDVEFARDEIVIDATKMIKAFVKNAISNNVKVVDIRGSVRNQGQPGTITKEES